ncbi:MAG: hypothetical protein ACFFDF_04450 [Candidatus Odinarchaeota archaeon]
MEKKKRSLKKILKSVIKSIILLFYIIIVVSLIIGGISAGIVTLIPDSASKPCYLGYYAHCSFTPFSTLILFAMALVGIILLIKFIKYVRRKYHELIELKPILKSIIKR